MSIAKITRYKNRKYYHAGKYITLEDIHKMLDNNTRVSVQLKDTGEDFTKKTLIELHRKLARELEIVKSTNILLKIKELDIISEMGENI